MKKRYILLLVLFLSSCVYAQKKWTTNWAIGPHLSMSFPQSDFADISKIGEGLGAKVFYRIESIPYFLTRADLTYLSFGEKRSSIFPGDPYSPSITTRTESFQLLIGPQFATKAGRFSFYLAPMAGIFNFRTLETIPLYYDPYLGSYYTQYYQETTNSLTRPGFAVNGGILFDLGLGPVIDFEIRYQNIHNAIEYTVDESKVKGDVTDLGVSLGVVFFINKTRKRRY